MKKYLLRTIMVLIGFNCSAQSIATALSHDRKPDIREKPHIIEITTTTTYYRKNVMETLKTVSTYNIQNMLVSEIKYDNEENIKARLNFIYDSTNAKSITRKFETWNRVIGHSVEITEYVYDEKGYLIETIDKNVNNQPFRISSLKNNDQGYPIQLVLKELNSNFNGVEFASYDFDKNLVKISVLDENGKTLSTNEMRINFEERKFNDLVYNDFGDLIKSNGKEYEYKYDKFNNWIKKTWYKYLDGKKRKYQVSTRKIKYKK
ncbi:hypothetical protein SAMN04487906_2050 [Zhouia amylolytica]|uniref:YD repeat-containing protein n=1 Tax=Zhouia amylolytica TaxID=376730 RepID=A0A1I6TPR4_9FLAO|nr:hypothetical protein [Zhouia amylolytica]SFS91196.1 hypothetical protein SAMN04487906_2050 [Zhouia amylolytica]